MARKPNYQFERMERDRAKAAKLAEKAARRRSADQDGGDLSAGEATLDAPPPAKAED